MTPGNLRSLKILLLAVCAFLWQSCGGDTPAPVTEQKMRDILFDIQVAEAYSANVDTGAERGKKNADTLAYYYALVLKKHGISLAEWETAIEWYMEHPAAFEPVFTQVIDTANTFKKDEMLNVEDADPASAEQATVQEADSVIKGSEFKPLERPLKAKQLDKPAISDDLSKEIDKEERDVIKKNSKEKREALEKVKNEQ